MAISELVRRWGLLVLGVALLIVGIIVIIEVPEGDSRYLLGWGMSSLGVVLSALWIAAEVRRRRGPPDGPGSVDSTE
jgi:FtsH-binding integral membrane protein